MPNLATELCISLIALSDARRDAAFDNLREVLSKPFGLRYRVAERHRSRCRPKVAPKICAGRPPLAKPVPASDHPPPVVHVQFRARVRQQSVQVNTHLLQVDIEYQDLIVGQDAHFDSFAETETVKFGTIEGLVVHRRQGRESVVVSRPSLGGIAVDAGRGSHVQSPVPRYEFIVVDPPKVGFALASQRRTSGAVRLVANYQVELGQPFLLRFRHGVERLICGEDHRHGGVSLRVAVSLRESRGIGGRG